MAPRVWSSCARQLLRTRFAPTGRRGGMHHQERPATALAHGPAKPDDIERARRDVTSAETHDAAAGGVERAVGGLEGACRAVPADLDTPRRAPPPKGPPPPANGTEPAKYPAPG